MSVRYVVREARLEEAPLLAAAQRESARVPGQLASLPDEIKDEQIGDKIAWLRAQESGYAAVLEEDGVVVGHAFVEPHRLAVTSHVVFLTIVIHEGQTGRGLGRRLMEHLVEWAKANPKVEKFELQVRATNARAIRLYQRLGFVEEGRKTRRLKYGPGDYRDDIYMALWVG